LLFLYTALSSATFIFIIISSDTRIESSAGGILGNK
jgi:hypothetical protein